MQHLLGIVALLVLAHLFAWVNRTAGMSWAIASVAAFDLVLGTVFYRAFQSGKWTSDRACC